MSEGILSRSASRTLHPRFSESHTTKTETEQQGFSATLLYKGYLDDPRNTDNAWVEAEVWNFHYDLGDDLDIRLKGVSIENIGVCTFCCVSEYQKECILLVSSYPMSIDGKRKCWIIDTNSSSCSESFRLSWAWLFKTNDGVS